MPEVKVVQLDMKSRDLTGVFSPDCQAITGVVGKTVGVWNLVTGDCIRQLEAWPGAAPTT